MRGAAAPSMLAAGSGKPWALSDESLALRAANGDERAFAAIFNRYHQGLYRYCLVLVGNHQDAQDALQNTMIKVLRALPGEDRPIALKPWLYRIAHNESVDLLRRRRETRPLDPDLPAAGSSLAEAAAVRERLRSLISDLERLPERQRLALVMRELAGFGFADIGTALGTSAAVVRQTLYEARLSLRQMDHGREMSCEAVARALSDGDGRVARRRDLRTHLRGCADCRCFGEEIKLRERDFAALAPLPAAAAGGLLQGLLGAHGATGGGLASALGGGVAKSIGASAALKGAATVAVVAAVGIGAADRSHLIDIGLPGSGHSQVTPAQRQSAGGPAETQPSPSGSSAIHVAAGSPAGARAASHLGASRTTRPLGEAGHGDAAKLTETAKPGAEQVVTSDSAKPGEEPGPAPTVDTVADSHGRGHEKQLPSASAHGQETAASHEAANHGQETAASHKSEGNGSGAPSHPAHPSKPAHPAQSSNPGAEEETPPAQPSPAAPEPDANGNAKGQGNGKGASAGAGEAPPGHEAGKKP